MQPLKKTSECRTGSGWNLKHSYKKLGEDFFSKVLPEPVPDPGLVLFNHDLASELGLDFSDDSEDDLAALFSGNILPPAAEPVALAYAGHQFGHFTILGDGRAILLGEQVTPDQRRLDIQLKGSGRTPYSRSGDGRGTLSSMLREYLMSEAMHALRVPTSRSLAVASTGLTVYREKEHPGAVLTRVASSHIRVGTMEFVRHFLSAEHQRKFTDYVIHRHYPHLLAAFAENTSPEEDLPLNLAAKFLEAVMDRQINLVLEWMRVGFIHGVMNTDNMSLAGETIDYGPCAFMNTFDPQTVFSSIDVQGRYAFANQPAIVRWNLAVMAAALMMPVNGTKEEKAERFQSVLDSFPELFTERWYRMMFSKLGLKEEQEGDRKLVDQLLFCLRLHKMDYTHAFSSLSSGQLPGKKGFKSGEFIRWHEQWKTRADSQHGGEQQARKSMQRYNPVFIPRNHLVEEVLERACGDEDLSKFNELLHRLKSPYAYPAGNMIFQSVPEGFDAGYQTYCGT